MDRKTALKDLQKLGSVGPKMAAKIYDLGYKTIESLTSVDPVAMYQQYSAKVGGYADPCVEDVFRCAIAQAKYPDLPEKLKSWWAWTNERGKSRV